MRTIRWTSAFRRDYKRISASRRDIELLLGEIVGSLAEDRPLQEKYRDHLLSGNWREHRECHLKPDLLLIYKKPSPETLWLVRMGSHSELFAK